MTLTRRLWLLLRPQGTYSRKWESRSPLGLRFDQSGQLKPGFRNYPTGSCWCINRRWPKVWEVSYVGVQLFPCCIRSPNGQRRYLKLLLWESTISQSSISFNCWLTNKILIILNSSYWKVLTWLRPHSHLIPLIPWITVSSICGRIHFSFNLSSGRESSPRKILVRPIHDWFQTLTYIGGWSTDWS